MQAGIINICMLESSGIITWNDLMKHLLSNDLLRLSQHGFMPKKSCTTNLLEFLEKLIKMDEDEAKYVIFLDVTMVCYTVRCRTGDCCHSSGHIA